MPSQAVSRVRDRWAQGTSTANAWLTVPNSLVAEATARAGFDSVCVDMQHGMIDFDALVPMLQAIQLADAVALVRVPWNEPSILMRVLDAGADGVIVPMVSTPEQAEAAVAACRYPPRGIRSAGPTRAGLIAQRSYVEHATEDTLVFVMIETAEALDRLDAILDTPALDGVYIGPADLSLAMGFPPETDSTRPAHAAAIARIVDACHERGLVAGLHTATPEFARERAAAGMDFLTVATDLSSLRQEVGRRLERFRAGPD